MPIVYGVGGGNCVLTTHLAHILVFVSFLELLLGPEEGSIHLEQWMIFCTENELAHLQGNAGYILAGLALSASPTSCKWIDTL